MIPETTSPVTTYLAELPEDLRLLQSIFRMEERILRREPERTPYEDFTLPVSADTLARYNAAIAGRVFEPKQPSKKRRNRKEPETYVPVELARDIYRVHHNMLDGGNIAGNAQLPPVPLRGLAPISVVNNIVQLWRNDLSNPNGKHEHPELTERLEGIANLILHEAHPDRQELTTPRQRSKDTQIEEPLLIHQIPRVRDQQAQVDSAQTNEVSDLDFVVVKSVVGAMVTLISQHKLSPDVEGLPEMYRRGLIPLSLTIKDDQVVDAITKLIGRTREEIYDAVAKVESTHMHHRANSVLTLLNEYDRFVELIALQKEASIRAALSAAQEKRNETKQPNNPPNAASRGGRRAAAAAAAKAKLDEKNALAESKVEGILDRTGNLLFATSRFAQQMTDFRNDRNTVPDHLLTSYLPRIGLRDLKSQDEVHVTTIEGRNTWFIASYLNSLRVLPSTSILTASIAPNFSPAIEASEKNLTTYTRFLDGRTCDIFAESILAHMLARNLFESEDRGPEFAQAIDILEKISLRLEKLHMNTIAALRDTTAFKEGIGDTSMLWAKLAELEIVRGTPKDNFDYVQLDDKNGVMASMIFHVPPTIVRQIFNDELLGLNWGITQQDYDIEKAEMIQLDPTHKIMEMAQNVRSQIGCGGKTIRSGAGKFMIYSSKESAIARALRPMAAHYDDMFDGLTAKPLGGASKLSDALGR